MTIPNFPAWATNANYSTAGDAFDGTPTKVDPSAISQNGFRPGTAHAAQYVNHLFSALGAAYGAWLVENMLGNFLPIMSENMTASTSRFAKARFIAAQTTAPGQRKHALVPYGDASVTVAANKIQTLPCPIGSTTVVPGGDTTFKGEDSASGPTYYVLTQNATSTSNTGLAIGSAESFASWTHRPRTVFDASGCDSCHYAGNDKYYFWRDNSGAIWRNDSADLTISTFTSLPVSGTDIRGVTSLQDDSGLTLAIRDDGSTIRSQRIDTSVGAVTVAVSAGNKLRGCAASATEFFVWLWDGSQGSQLYASDDNGATWALRSSPTVAPGNHVSDKRRMIHLNGWLIIYGTDRLAVSNDSGRTWYYGRHNLDFSSAAGTDRMQVLDGRVYHSSSAGSAMSVGAMGS